LSVEIKYKLVIMRGKLANPTLFPVNAYQLEAMINVLERKGMLTAKEVMDELEVIVATKEKKETN